VARSRGLFMGGSNLIPIRSKEQISIIERNSQLLAQIMDLLAMFILPGRTTRQIDLEVGRLLQRQGTKSALLERDGYPARIVANVNDCVASCLPSDRELMSGDMLTVVVAVERGGFFLKIHHCYSVGKLSADTLLLREATEAALQAALAKAIAGNRVSDISLAIESEATGYGYCVPHQWTGHGIGQALHGAPLIPFHVSTREGPRLLPGMVLQILVLLMEGSSPDARIAQDGSARKMDGGKACSMGTL
jgi:methionyl aminopeptidase